MSSLFNEADGNSDYVASNGCIIMHNELERMRMKAVVASTKVPSRYLPVGMEEDMDVLRKTRA